MGDNIASKLKSALFRGAGLVSLLALASCAGNDLSLTPRSVSIESNATSAAATLTASMDKLIKQTSPSYVTIVIREKRSSSLPNDARIPRALTSGSGFVIDSSGYILTAGHVAVRTGTQVRARGADGQEYKGVVLNVQRSPDIALIKLHNFTGLPVVPVSSPCLTKGAAVFSLGRPHAQGDTARIGEVFSMRFGRPVSYNGFGYPDAMVLKMNTKKGESGGPVFNKSARLSGMMVSTLSDGRGHSLNLAHALPVSMLARFACSSFSCSPSWRKLSHTSIKSCRS